MVKWLVIALIAGAGLFFGYQRYSGKPGGAAASATSKRSTTALAEVKDIKFEVVAAGEIGPAEQVSVKPEINGKIQTLTVDIGDEVKKGQVLFTLDDAELQNQRASMLTDIERSRLQLTQSERNFKRSDEMHKAELISQELYENAKTEYDLAKNSVERSNRELAILEERLTKTKIVAPFDCTVLTRPVSVGQAVSGSGGFNSGTEVLTIADLNQMVINAHINQADITHLVPNSEVGVSIEAVTGLTVTGVVERIAPQATIRNNIKGFAVRIVLKNVDKRVRPGMTANIRIPVASVEKVIAVPLAAVFTERDARTQRSERYVLVKKGEMWERRTVKIGVSDFFFAEVTDGLAAGDVVTLEMPKDTSKIAATPAPQGEGKKPGPAAPAAAPKSSQT